MGDRAANVTGVRGSVRRLEASPGIEGVLEELWSPIAALTAAHGGRVSVRETPGGGATFRVELPAGAAA
jgi:hypothetical protein